MRRVDFLWAQTAGDHVSIQQLEDRLPRTLAVIEHGIEQSWHFSAQLCVWHDGQVVADDGVGTTDGTTPVNAETVHPWLSAGKPIGAVAAKLLERRGVLDLDLPVADYWPEFGTNGKEAINTRHLLTHTAGILTAEKAAFKTNPGEVLSILVNAPIAQDWIPGKRAGYHAFSGWQVLGELVRRTSEVPFDEFVHKNVLEPLGMESATYSLSPGKAAQMGERLSPMHTFKDGTAVVAQEYSPDYAPGLVRPGNGLFSTSSDLNRFYRMLLGFGELDGARVLAPAETADILSPHRTGMLDETFGHVMDWGLGVMFDNKIHGPAPYGYGPHASARAFGHGGRESSTGFADPEYDLAVTLVFNGMPGEPRHDRRLKMVTAAIYEDLGLA